MYIDQIGARFIAVGVKSFLPHCVVLVTSKVALWPTDLKLYS